VSGVLVRGVAWGGGRADIRCAGERIAAVADDLEPLPGEEVVTGTVTVLPGLHDHHLHLLAMAARRTSVDLGPGRVSSPADLATALSAASRVPGDGDRCWIRAVGYDETTGGPLDRWLLDRVVPDRPVRVQHRSGHLWVLNSAACRLVGLDHDPPRGAERADGAVNGRLVDADAWLGPRVPAEAPDLAPVGRRLASFGVTGVTDATPVDRPGELTALAAAAGGLAQRTTLMGGTALAGAAVPPGLALGPVKVMVGDAAYPSVDELAEAVAGAHGHGRTVALHCATRIAAVLAVAAWEAAGSRPGDRMEHGAVLPPDLIRRLAVLRVTVVTQPGFVHDRGDRYRRDVEPDDVAHLYRCASLEAAGVAVGGGTDAPFGPDDPWLAMRTAVTRRTRTGAPVGPDEAIAPRRALDLFLSRPDAPGGPPRAVAAGGPADLVLLDCTLAEALDDLDARHVLATVVRGQLVHRA